jgi:hypothetical protein
MVVVIFSAMFKERASTMNDYRGSAMNDYTMVVVIFSATPRRALFNYITTGAFTSVGSLFAPVVKQDSQMNWALLIISKKSTLLPKAASVCFLIFSNILDIPSYKSQNSQEWC